LFRNFYEIEKIEDTERKRYTESFKASNKRNKI
jgi:hypothetical protein